jgi:hypothetical protein
MKHDQQLQFLQVHGLQRQPAPAEQPQFLSVFTSLGLVISILLFRVAQSERIAM